MEIDGMFAMSLIPGIGYKKQKALYEMFSSQGILDASRKQLEGCKSLTNTDIDNIILYSRNRSYFCEEMEKMKNKGIRFVARGTKEYPDGLNYCHEPPWGIFVKGAMPAKNKKKVAIVGARMCTPYGKSYAKEIARNLSNHDVQIVSGMARGIDGYAQEEVVRCEGETFSVLAGGVDMIYPPEHDLLYEGILKNGGVISEYPIGIKPCKGMFPRRNRMISALSDAVIVIEARTKSGSFITADFALEQGKDIFVLPGRINDPLSEGCNRYIKQGAQIITSISELLEELGIENNVGGEKKEENKLLLEKEYSLVYSCLRLVPKGLDELALESGLGLIRVIEIVSKLQDMGMVEECYKNQYIRST